MSAAGMEWPASMGIASQERLRNRLTGLGLVSCLALTALLQLNGRSILGIAMPRARSASYATLVQPNAKGIPGLHGGTGPVGTWLDAAHRSLDDVPREVAAAATVASGDTPVSGGIEMTPGSQAEPDGVAATLAALVDLPSGHGGSAGGRSGPGAPLSAAPGPGGGGMIAPTSTPTPDPGSTPIPPEATPTPDPKSAPVMLPTPIPTPTAPAPPVAVPTPVSVVPEPAGWALLLAGVALVGGLIRWRRRTIDAATNAA
jgi:hypothetical protein